MVCCGKVYKLAVWVSEQEIHIPLTYCDSIGEHFRNFGRTISLGGKTPSYKLISETFEDTIHDLNNNCKKDNKEWHFCESLGMMNATILSVYIPIEFTCGRIKSYKYKEKTLIGYSDLYIKCNGDNYILRHRKYGVTSSCLPLIQNLKQVELVISDVLKKYELYKSKHR